MVQVAVAAVFVDGDRGVPLVARHAHGAGTGVNRIAMAAGGGGSGAGFGPLAAGIGGRSGEHEGSHVLAGHQTERAADRAVAQGVRVVAAAGERPVQLSQTRGAAGAACGLPGALGVKVQVEAVGPGGVLAAATHQAASEGPAFAGQGQSTAFEIEEVVAAAGGGLGSARGGPLALDVGAGKIEVVGEGIGGAVSEIAVYGNAIAAVGIRALPGVGPLVGAASGRAARGGLPAALAVEHQLGGGGIRRMVAAVFGDGAAVAPAITGTATGGTGLAGSGKASRPAVGGGCGTGLGQRGGAAFGPLAAGIARTNGILVGKPVRAGGGKGAADRAAVELVRVRAASRIGPRGRAAAGKSARGGLPSALGSEAELRGALGGRGLRGRLAEGTAVTPLELEGHAAAAARRGRRAASRGGIGAGTGMGVVGRAVLVDCGVAGFAPLAARA